MAKRKQAKHGNLAAIDLLKLSKSQKKLKLVKVLVELLDDPQFLMCLRAAATKYTVTALMASLLANLAVQKGPQKLGEKDVADKRVSKPRAKRSRKGGL